MFDIFDVINSGKSKQKKNLNSIRFVQIVGDRSGDRVVKHAQDEHLGKILYIYKKKNTGRNHFPD